MLATALYANTVSAEEAEIRAIWAANRRAIDLKIPKLMVESDAEVVITQLQRKVYEGPWNTDALLKDIGNWCSCFEGISFCFVSRNYNGVAHDLAQWGKNSCMDMFWSTSPVWLIPSLERDRLLI
ncbi:hypothetical protein BVC80_1751g98 [Macleaya cordata]|uniref:RNase H type-1 domain-containing protein n=1 Tax=Macleaya cordata TaxID=56857 RepID=A0A200QHN8_MACCD|nr:hypothetical protein BVC80_1751g98 [Macleaya cordata]